MWVRVGGKGRQGQSGFHLSGKATSDSFGPWPKAGWLPPPHLPSSTGSTQLLCCGHRIVCECALPSCQGGGYSSWKHRAQSVPELDVHAKKNLQLSNAGTGRILWCNALLGSCTAANSASDPAARNRTCASWVFFGQRHPSSPHTQQVPVASSGGAAAWPLMQLRKCLTWFGSVP